MTVLMNKRIAARIEAAGFNELNESGVTDAVIAQRLGISKDQVHAYRLFRGANSSYFAKRDWMTTTLRHMARRSGYHRMTIAEVAERLGTTTKTLRAIFAETGIPSPHAVRNDLIAQLREQGYSPAEIAHRLGTSKYHVSKVY